MIMAAMETMAEAFTLGGKHGVRREKTMEVMAQSLFAAPVYVNYGKRRDMADSASPCHGKETQRSAAGKTSGIDGTVRLKPIEGQQKLANLFLRGA